MDYSEYYKNILDAHNADAKKLRADLFGSRDRQIAELKDQLAVSQDLAQERLKLLKTAKADGIREAITDLIQLTDDDFLLLDGYADQLEADNGKAS